MPKRDVEDELSALAALANAPNPADLIARLSAALESKSNLVVAKGAAIIAKLNCAELGPNLTALLTRLLDPGKSRSDKGCLAKTAAAKALLELGEYSARDAFAVGARHVQMEAGWGRPVDVAAELRGTCGAGLVRLGDRRMMSVLVELIADPEAQTRATAARALAYSGRDEAALLLRLKLLSGDVSLDVICECLSALVALQRRESVDFIEARFLHADAPETRAAAAAALGEAKDLSALAALRRRFAVETDHDARRAVLAAAAMLRYSESIDWLISLVESSRSDPASAAIEALAIFKNDPALCRRVCEAIATADDQARARAFEHHFAGGASPD